MAGIHRRRRTYSHVGFTGRLVTSSLAALAVLVLSGGTTKLPQSQAGAQGPRPSVTNATEKWVRPGEGSVAASTDLRRDFRAALPARSGAGRRIVYCNSCQRVWLVEADTSISRSYQVSGRQGVPRPGMYDVTSKSDPAFSEHGLRLNHMVRFATGNRLPIGFHAIPVSSRGPIQPLRLLGRPLSSGCVRQAPADARALWEFAETGTPVVVLA